MNIPAPDPITGFHPTLNAMGGMSPDLDEYSQAFIDFAGETKGRVLDVGACYGLVSFEAARNGATVWVNDLDGRHLALARDGAPIGAKLKWVEGRFPEDIPWNDGPLDAVLLARVLHYMDGPEIDRALAATFENLRPGGKTFGVTITPFLQKLKAHQSDYQAKKAAGDRWPGLVRVADWDPEGAKGLTPTLHTLDREVLSRALTEAGFVIEKLEYFSRQEFVRGMSCDGREALGFIALKPSVGKDQT